MTNELKAPDMAGELEPCPFCNAALTKPTPVQYPKMGLARVHPGSLDDGSCPIAGWGFYDEQLTAWNLRTTLANTDAMRAENVMLREALAECSGVLSDIPAPSCHGLWLRMVDAIQKSRYALTESPSHD